MVDSKHEFIEMVNQQCRDAKAKGKSECYATASAIIRGTCICYSLGTLPIKVDSPAFDMELLSDETEEVQEIVLDWIQAHCIKIKTVNKRHTSYGLKHILERDTGIYLTNNQFKHAMLIAGHMPEYEHELNWHFRISEKKI